MTREHKSTLGRPDGLILNEFLEKTGCRKNYREKWININKVGLHSMMKRNKLMMTIEGTIF